MESSALTYSHLVPQSVCSGLVHGLHIAALTSFTLPVGEANQLLQTRRAPGDNRDMIKVIEPHRLEETLVEYR